MPRSLPSAHLNLYSHRSLVQCFLLSCLLSQTHMRLNMVVLVMKSSTISELCAKRRVSAPPFLMPGRLLSSPHND